MATAEKIMSVRLSAKAASDLEALSRRTDQPQARLLREAVESFLDREAYTLARIEAGIAQADRGEIVPHEQVMTDMRLIIDEARRGR